MSFAVVSSSPRLESCVSLNHGRHREGGKEGRKVRKERKQRKRLDHALKVVLTFFFTKLPKGRACSEEGFRSEKEYFDIKLFSAFHPT